MEMRIDLGCYMVTDNDYLLFTYKSRCEFAMCFQIMFRNNNIYRDQALDGHNKFTYSLIVKNKCT